MVSSPVVTAVILCLFVSSSHEVDEIKGFLDESQLNFPSEEETITNISERENDIVFQESACDCGPNSKGCKIENGTKVCECEYHFRQENGLCKDWCDDTWRCENGGICVNESCQCLPGTFGGFCKGVEACEGIKGPLLCGDPDKVMCMFDAKTRKPYCHCTTLDFIYYPKTRDCIECDCGDAGSCSLIDGKKTCKCNEGAAVRKTEFWGDIVDRCVDCNCGDNSDGCSFDGLYKKICNCKEGFAQQPDLYGDSCNNCSCGPHGKCYFTGWYKNCDCDEGYAAFLNKNRTELTCEACDCGKNGVCSFEEEVKQCKCNPGYALRDGICTSCQCYVESEIAQCKFTNNIQTCLCPGGYEATKFICKDINECLNSSNSCPPTTDCYNTRGSYECICKEGYAPIGPIYDIKKDGCEDINECENENLCPRNHTICINLPGNYSCTCEKGYEPVPPYFTPIFGGCQKVKEKNDDSSPWKTVLIVIGILMCSCILAFFAVMFIRRRSSERSPLRTESTLHRIR